MRNDKRMLGLHLVLMTLHGRFTNRIGGTLNNISSEDNHPYIRRLLSRMFSKWSACLESRMCVNLWYLRVTKEERVKTTKPIGRWKGKGRLWLRPMTTVRGDGRTLNPFFSVFFVCISRIQALHVALLLILALTRNAILSTSRSR